MERNLYLSAVRWSPELVDALSEGIDGVIFGDPFCQKRMFANSAFDIPEMARLAKALGLRVAYQTPVYNTPRTIEDTLALARYLAQAELVDVFLVHDIGVLDSLRAHSNAEIWWDRYSLNRDMDVSDALLRFLGDQGVAAIELTRGMDLPRAARSGLKTGLHLFGPSVAAFGRACYTEYFLNEACEQKILCKRDLPQIESVDKVRLEYIADGHTLVDSQRNMFSAAMLMPGQAAAVAFGTATVRTVAEAKSAIERFHTLLALRPCDAR